MFWKRKSKPDQACAHTWRLVDYVYTTSNGLDIDDYFELHCEKCGNKRMVDEYTYGRLQRYGLVKQAK